MYYLFWRHDNYSEMSRIEGIFTWQPVLVYWPAVLDCQWDPGGTGCHSGKRACHGREDGGNRVLAAPLATALNHTRSDRFRIFPFYFCWSLKSYFCSQFRTKDTAEPRWLIRLMQCWFLLILWPKEVVNMFLVFWFVPLSLSYDPKREGHPFKVKGITEILSWS